MNTTVTNTHISPLTTRLGDTIDNVKPLVFIVEDDADIARLERHHLESSEFSVRTFGGVQGVLAEAEKNAPALFLLDIMLPGGDGIELCSSIRKHPKLASIPVIFVTARTTEADRILGLELGADDYIPKPFSPRELVARVKAVLRRFERPLPPKITKIGDLVIDAGAMMLTVRGKAIPTTATEFRLLEFLMSRPGVVFSREQLLDAVWGHDRAVTDRTVDVYVLRLRQKIEQEGGPAFIRSVRGFGYSFNVEVPQEQLQ